MVDKWVWLCCLFNKNKDRRVHLFRCTNAFNGGDDCPICNTTYLGDARQREFAIHNDRTGAAVTIIARNFRAGQEQLLAQNISPRSLFKPVQS
jgi:hypothetical protein